MSENIDYDNSNAVYVYDPQLNKNLIDVRSLLDRNRERKIERKEWKILGNDLQISICKKMRKEIRDARKKKRKRENREDRKENS